MSARRTVLGLVLVVGLAASGAAQDVGLHVAAGAFLASESVYREIYGGGVSFLAEIWLKTKGPFGVSTGFAGLKDSGLAVAQGGGDEEYRLAFRRTTIPAIAFYELDLKAVQLRFGAGVGIHSYRERWREKDFVFDGRKVSPRFVFQAWTRLAGRLSFVGTFVYEGVSTGAGSVLASNVDLGGYQFIAGLSYRFLR
jgi:hypothetical protein